mgnify:CR=1 FL=1
MLSQTAETEVDNGSEKRPSQKSKSIGRKKELVQAVRDSNPAATNPAPNIFWDVEGNLKTTAIDAGGVKQQLTIVENGVNYSAKRFNDMKVANIRATNDLKAKLDELEVQKKAWEDLDAMKKAETEEGRRIDQLNRDTNTVEEDIARKEHYTRQLEYVLQRLRRNQIKFDAHMNGMEETMRAIEKEAREVKLLRRGLDSGLARASHVEEETRARLNLASTERGVLLQNRRNELKNAEMLQGWLEYRDQAKTDLALALRGDLSKDEEALLINQLREKQDKTRNLQRANEESHKLLQQMEDEFMLIKQVTGVSSLEEMLDKVSSQKPNKANLEAEVKEAENKLAVSKKASLELEQQFQELKSSGTGVADISRDITNQLEAEISAARQQFKITHALTERLNAVLVGLQQGGNGLVQRVHPYLHMADASVFELTQQDDDVEWAVSMEALSSAEQVLAKMMELCAAGDASPNKMNLDDDDEISRDDSTLRNGLESLDTGPCFTNNIRIISRKHLRETENPGEDDEINNAYETLDGSPGNLLMGGDSLSDDGLDPSPAQRTTKTAGGVEEEDVVPSRLNVRSCLLRPNRMRCVRRNRNIVVKNYLRICELVLWITVVLEMLRDHDHRLKAHQGYQLYSIHQRYQRVSLFVTIL